MKTLDNVLDELSSQKTLNLNDIKYLRVCVTGAGGSVGTHLCRELYRLGVRSFLLIDSNELSLYTVNRELVALGCSVVPLLCSYGMTELIRPAFEQFKPEVVYHAGAFKHVPLVEVNWKSAFHNNVMAAARFFTFLKVFHPETELVVISSDKAVAPSSFMGVTKRLVEEIALHKIPKAKIVRFGNVMGSSGSVIPLFYKQISEDKPVTITDMEVTRYFMTMAQAASLVIFCNRLHGNRFYLNMGAPVKIIDLAKKIAAIMGKHFHYEVVGLRPGEKLYEELTLSPTSYLDETGLVYTVYEPEMSHNDLFAILDYIANCKTYDDLVAYLTTAGIGYVPKDVPNVTAPTEYHAAIEDCFHLNSINAFTAQQGI